MTLRVEIEQDFPFAVEKVFADLTGDHEKLGQILGAPMKHLVDGKDARAGVGSVRRVGPPIVGLQETVVTRQPNQLLEYRVTKGGPLKNHLGRMEFSSTPSGSRLHYVITFDMKPGFGWFGSTLRNGLRSTIGKALAKYARSGN